MLKGSLSSHDVVLPTSSSYRRVLNYFTNVIFTNAPVAISVLHKVYESMDRNIFCDSKTFTNYPWQQFLDDYIVCESVKCSGAQQQ